MKLTLSILLLSGVCISSCRVAERSIAGTYHPANDSHTRLVLREDNSFELAVLNPATDTLLFSTDDPMNFRTTGHWHYNNRRLLLKPAPMEDFQLEKSVRDSITRFTNISSFNFWNRYGDQVPIRYIVLPPARPKPHFGNSLFFFAQDFKETDTLKFYFDGYPPFDFPGTIPRGLGNNIHKIVLTEPYRADVFSSMGFIVGRNKLRESESNMKFLKKK